MSICIIDLDEFSRKSSSQLIPSPVSECEIVWDSHTDVCSDTMANLVLFLLAVEPMLEVSLLEALFMLDRSRPPFKLPENF